MSSFSVLVLALYSALSAHAITNTNIFFNSTQIMTVVASNITTVTINSGGYLFTYSQDGYFSGGGGTPTGRFFTVIWPNGVQAQAYTAGPLSGTGANITVKRADGKLFDFQSFTGKILLNTAGAGGAFEIMPQLNGNDAFANPLQYDCTGYSGMSFYYNTGLAGCDTYQIHMWGDFALTALTLTDTNRIPPPGPTNTITVSVSPAGAGTVGGAGDYASNSICSLTASANSGWGFKNWTQNGAQVSSSPTYNFTVVSNRTLVANFVAAYTVSTALYPACGGSVTGGGTFNSNSTVVVRAVAASGYQFINWTDSGLPVSTAANYSFVITGNHALAANFLPEPQTGIFDFDTGFPAVGPTQGMPSSQSNNAVTAYFSTVAGGWSVQDAHTSVIGATPNLSGNFLYPSTWGSTFAIQFDSPVTNLAFDFMTGDVSSEYNTATTARVTAYTNSTATPAVGSGTAQGQWISGAYPEGHLNFSSATPFNIVVVDYAPGGIVSDLMFVDNIVVQRVGATAFNVAATVSPTSAGIVSGAGDYASGATATLSASANFGWYFTGWTENGVPVGALPNYVYSVASNRALVAVFATNLPPIANGGNFFQLAGTPLAINVGDMIAFDFDQDGEPVAFTGFDATTMKGLTLTANAAQILVPANSIPDSFTYTITDNNGGTAMGTIYIGIITNAASRGLSLSLKTVPGYTVVNFTGVPWYTYTVQRATNVTFTGTVLSWPVQAWADGSISCWDNFTDLGGTPQQAFWRLSYP